ncbi:ABC transporter ATP-binding protein [Devosia sp. A449]
MSRLEIDHLVKRYALKVGLAQQIAGRQPSVHAVSDVSFDIAPGEVVGLVGESGCGKTTLGKVLVRLEEPSGGQVRLDGQDVTRLSGASLRGFRKSIQMVFQDPYDTLNPRRPIIDAVEQPLRYLGLEKSATARRALAMAALEQVELGASGDYADRYPHQLSGGQRQRVAIARALVVQPKVIIADEPVSMLDVSVRASILKLLGRLNRDRGISMLLITHDLATAKFLCDRVLVMYLGKIVEELPVAALPGEARHPYSKLLIASVPDLHRARNADAPRLEGEVPSAVAPPSGCRFRTRCPVAIPRCAAEEPLLRELGPKSHRAACHLI